MPHDINSPIPNAEAALMFDEYDRWKLERILRSLKVEEEGRKRKESIGVDQFGVYGRNVFILSAIAHDPTTYKLKSRSHTMTPNG